MYCGPKIAGFGLNVAEKNDAKAAIRVSSVIFFTTTKVVRTKATNMNAENPCSRTSSSEFMLIFTPPSIATAPNMMGRPGGSMLYQTSPGAAFGSFALITLVCWIFFAKAMFVAVS